jgi:hypothetical protein
MAIPCAKQCRSRAKQDNVTWMVPPPLAQVGDWLRLDHAYGIQMNSEWFTS